MKKILLLPVLFFSVVLISCKKEVPETPLVNPDIAVSGKPGISPLINVFSQPSSWVVVRFTTNGTDETTAFNGYRLLFQPDNSVECYNDIYAIPGNWYPNGADAGALQMQLFFNAPDRLTNPVWNNLAGTWNLVKARDNDVLFNRTTDQTVLELQRLPVK